MLSVIDEDQISDVVTFAVRNPSHTLLHNTLSYYTESVSIFSSNPVFAKLIRKWKAKQKRHLKLPHMTIAAFTFIRDGFHGRYSGMNPQNVVDIYSAAKHYQLNHIVHQCNHFLSNIHDVDDYFIVHNVFAKYPKSLYDSFLSTLAPIDKITDILLDHRLIASSNIFQIQSLCHFVLSRHLVSHQQCYAVSSKWCRFHFESTIQPLLSILDGCSSGASSDDSGSME